MVASHRAVGAGPEYVALARIAGADGVLVAHDKSLYLVHGTLAAAVRCAAPVATHVSHEWRIVGGENARG